jgi:diguanylate cyclase (GGDEF)-like protein
MSGLSTVLFAAGMVLALALAFAGGLSGWWAACFLLTCGWCAIAIFGWVDAGVLAVEALSAGLLMWLALRWTLRHQAWQKRIGKDRGEGHEAQLQIQGAVQALKDRIVAKASDVDRGLKQYELIRKLAEAVSWEEMSPSLEKALKYFFRVEGWSVHLTDSRGELQFIQRRGAAPELRGEDLAKKEPFLYAFVAPNGPNAPKGGLALGIPLWRLHERIGMLLLKIPDMPADQQSALLSEANNFGVQLIFAMAKAKLFRELDLRSRTDGLTGLLRRGPFEERLKEEVARARSFRSTFSILMIDIDHFKHLNDTYGHQVGDEVLKTVAQRLREGIYETDVIARYGGEEFICLLPRSDPAGLRIKADQLRQRVANQAFVIGLEAIQVTMSVGIAHFPQDGQTAEAVLGAADRALYAAKAAGRNCVVEAASIA